MLSEEYELFPEEAEKAPTGPALKIVLDCLAYGLILRANEAREPWQIATGYAIHGDLQWLLMPQKRNFHNFNPSKC